MICQRNSQRFAVKGGAPISEVAATRRIGGRGGSGLSTTNIRRYTIGPTLEVALPLRLRFQADVLYKRLERAEQLSGPGFRTKRGLAANSWEFPLLLKYVWGRGTIRPFAAAGGALRRINSFGDQTTQQFIGVPPPGRVTQFRVQEQLTQSGWVVSSGVRFDASVLKISPEIRYTRWTSLRFLPTKNQVEFLLGVMF